MAATRIIKSGAQLQALLNDLIDFNRTNLGLGIGADPVSVDLVKLFADVLEQLRTSHLVATRSTGFNHIDLEAAEELGVRVVRMTDYSPNSVDEFAVGLLLALNRKITRAHNRTPITSSMPVRWPA